MPRAANNGQILGWDKLARRLEAVKGCGKDVLRKVQTSVTHEAKQRAPRKTGNLGRSIKAGYLSEESAVVLAEADYAAYVEIGTGIYGPKHKPITPRTKRALAFHSQAAGRSRWGASYRLSGAMTKASEKKFGAGADFVVVKSVKGRKATPFMEPAAKRVAAAAGIGDVVVKVWNGAA